MSNTLFFSAVGWDRVGGTLSAVMPYSLSQVAKFVPSGVTKLADHAVNVGVNLFVQTTLVLGIGLLATWLFQRRSAALQSTVLKMTLLATLLCPIASLLLFALGVSGLRIEMPSDSSKMATPTVRTAVTQPLTQLAGALAANWPANDESADAQDHSESMSTSLADLQNETQRLQFNDIVNDSTAGVASGSATSPISTDSTSPTRLVFRLLLGLWFAFSGFLFTRLLVATFLMERIRRRSWPASNDVVSDCRTIAEKLSVTCPAVLLNDELSSPCLLGWLRPAVMIPSGLHPVGSDVLAHELAHLRRHDCFWNMLGHLAITVMPWQPLAWVLNRRMEEMADNVCDDYVLAHNFDRVAYARGLLSIAERFPASWTHATTTVGIAELQSSLGQRVQRILDSSRSLSIRTGRWHLTMVFVAAMLGTVVAGFLGTARTNAESNSDVKDKAEKPVVDRAAPVVDDSSARAAPRELIVSGVVLKPDGTVAAGATIRTAASVWAMMKTVLPPNFEPKMNVSMADDNGRFSIVIDTQPYGELKNLDERWLELWKHTAIAATLPGYGPAWIEYENIRPDAPFQLRLVDDQPIRGRIRNLEGKPIANAKIKVTGVNAAKNEDLSGWLAAIKAGEPPWTAIRQADRQPELRLIGIPENVTTDRDGVLTIRGLGKDRTIDLTFEGEEMAHRTIVVVSNAIEPIKRVISTPPFEGNQPVFGHDFEFAVPPSRPIEGIVVDSKSGLPLPGVSVESYKLADYPYANHRMLKSTTDSAGRFRLVGMPKAAGNEILLVPNDDQPYFMRTFDVPDPAGIGPVEIRVQLDQGIWIRGRVTDKMTHEPISGVRLHYLPFLTNKFAGAVSNFDKGGHTQGDQTRYVTDQDGYFRLVGLPGRAVVGAESVMKAYRAGVGYKEIDGPREDNVLLTWRNPINPSPSWPTAMREINPASTSEEVRLDFELDPGFSVSLRLVDGNKQPVAGAKIQGLKPTYGRGTSSATGTAMVVNLASDEARLVVAVDPQRNIGCATHVSPLSDGTDELTLELLPCVKVSGRLLNEDEPIPGITIEPRLEKDSRGFLERLESITTDMEGRFTGTLVPGVEYQLAAEGRGMKDTPYAIVVDKLSITPGKDIDLGDLVLSKDGKFVPKMKYAAGN